MRRMLEGKPDTGKCSAALGIASRTQSEDIGLKDLPEEIKRIDVFVSVTASDYRGDALKALLWALGQADLLDQVNFIVAGHLQRHIYMMQQLPAMRQVEQGFTRCHTKSEALALWEREVKDPTVKSAVEKALTSIDVWSESNLASVFETYREAMSKFCAEKAEKATESWLQEANDTIFGKDDEESFAFLYDEEPNLSDYCAFNYQILAESSSASESVRHVKWEGEASGPEYDGQFTFVEQAYEQNKHQLRDVLDRIAIKLAEKIAHARRSGYPKKGNEGYDALLDQAIKLALTHLKKKSALFLKRMNGHSPAQGIAYPFHLEKMEAGLYECLITLRESTQETRSAMAAGGSGAARYQASPVLVDIRIARCKYDQKEKKTSTASNTAISIADLVAHQLALAAQIRKMDIDDNWKARLIANSQWIVEFSTITIGGAPPPSFPPVTLSDSPDTLLGPGPSEKPSTSASPAEAARTNEI